jgi:hypothetical protein
MILILNLIFDKVDIEKRNQNYDQTQMKILEDRLNKIKEFTSKNLPHQQQQSSSTNTIKNDIEQSIDNLAKDAFKTSIKDSYDSSEDDEIVRKMLAKAEIDYKSKQNAQSDEVCLFFYKII